MEARILLAADFANLDKAGKLNIIGAFNRILARKFPTKHPIMYLVIRFAIELGEFDKERTLNIVLFDEDGNEKWKTGDIKFTVNAPDSGRTAEFHPIMQIQNVEFEKPGRYEFRVFVNDDLKGNIPLDAELDTEQIEQSKEN